MSTIQEAIDKYGGADEAYKNKLKEQVRDSMGYSNYVNKTNEAEGRPLALNLKGNITPAGIQQLVGGAMRMKKEEIDTYAGIAGSIDSAADSLATKMAAKKRSGENQYKYDTSFIFQPQDDLDRKILEYTQNPYNRDGSVKSLQQFQAETNKEFGGTESVMQRSPVSFDQSKRNMLVTGTKGQAAQFTSEQIDNRIAEHVPSDFISNEALYSFRFQGFGEEEATEQLLELYGDMIVAGREQDVPQELYPAAMATLTPTEQSSTRFGGAFKKTKGGTGGGRDTLIGQ